MKLNKKVTVLMPIYNAESYLKESIESILNQTFVDFDILAINDGSSDSSAEIIQSFSDKRVVYLANEQNMGIVKTLNRGLNLIESKYIIRMDSDDICLPSRFKEQVTFMDANPSIALSGTSIKIFNDSGKIRDKIVETNTKKIRTQLLFEAAIMHPTVILRNEVIKKENYHYDASHVSTEDLGLWQKISLKYEVANISSIQLFYRDNEFGITRLSQKNKEFYDKAHITVYKDLFRALEISLLDDEVIAYRAFLSGNLLFTKKETESISKVLKEIRLQLDSKKFDYDIYNVKASSYYRINCMKNNYNYREFKDTYKLFFLNSFKLTKKEQLKFVLQKIKKILF